MKICLNLLAAYSGGQLTRAREFIDRIDKQSIDVDLLVLKEKEFLSDLDQNKKISVINVRIKKGFFRPIRRVIWENVCLQKIFLENKCEIYLTFSHYLPKNISLKFPSMVGVSNLAPFSKQAWKAESLIAKIRLFFLKKTIISSCKRASKVLALSKECKRILINYDVDKSKIFVSSNGVSSFWGKVSRTDCITEYNFKKPFILYVSHFHNYKNYKNLVIAYSKLSKKYKEKYNLILIGNPDNKKCYREINSLVKKLNLTSQILLLPGLNRESLRRFYQRADLFVFASLIENSPNILLEAMMSEAPILSSNIEPMPEFCENAAYYFDPLNIEEISLSIENLLSSPNLRFNMKRMSKTQAKKFSWEKFTNTILEQISNIKKI
tara:strand:+ start:2053 stop:3192 length:1140 start_codon:yes stop_codon:yes gene_type:complete